MSWKDALTYGKAVLAKHGVDAAANTTRADDNLPFGGRVGGLLKLQLTPFIRAEQNGSLIKQPQQTDAIIRAISHTKLDIKGDLYRYYLALGDDDNEDEIYLQIFKNPQGAITELMYCTRLTRFVPETAEQQDAYTGENGTGLGEKTYSLWKEQCADIGVSASTCDAVFGNNQELVFRRDVGGDNDFVAPFEGTETRIDDAQGEHGLAQQIYFMPYVRTLADGATPEYLLISTEIIDSRNGEEADDVRAIYVNFMIGLTLEAERVVVQ